MTDLWHSIEPRVVKDHGASPSDQRKIAMVRLLYGCVILFVTTQAKLQAEGPPHLKPREPVGGSRTSGLQDSVQFLAFQAESGGIGRPADRKARVMNERSPRDGSARNMPLVASSGSSPKYAHLALP